MNAMLHVFSTHWIALLLACLAGLVTVSPELMTRVYLGDAYEGVAMGGTDVEEYYEARIQDAYDGHPRAASPDLYEYKGAPFIQPSLPEAVNAAMAKLLRIQVMDMVTVGKFLFPFLLYCTLYALLHALTGNKMTALAAPLAIMLASHMVFDPRQTLSFLTLRWQSISGMVDYARPINPQFSSLVFFSWLLLWHWWLKAQKRVAGIAAGVLLGLLVYVYPYAWMLAMAIAGCTFMLALFNARTKLSLPARETLFLILLACAVTIPYWINFLAASSHPVYAILQKRYGFYASRAPLWSDLLLIDFALLAVLYWKRVKDLTFYLLLAMALGITLLINQQVVTGMRFYPGHWHWYYTTPLTIMLCLLVLYRLIGERKRMQAFAAVAIVMGSAGFGMITQYNSFQALKGDTRSYQRYGAVFEWLHSHTDKDDVVLAQGKLNELIPVYTHNNIYFSRWGHFHLVPHARIYDGMFARLYLNGAHEENVLDLVTASNIDVYEYLYGRYRLRKGECKPACFSEEELRTIADEYLAWRADIDFEKFLKHYRLDYALWDTDKDPHLRLDQYPFLVYSVEINGVRVYSVTES